jgi:hypothetical protein
MTSQDKLTNPDPTSKWNLEDHLNLLNDTREWLSAYVYYFEQLYTSGKVSNPAFEEWSFAAQSIPQELEDAFIPWIKSY